MNCDVMQRKQRNISWLEIGTWHLPLLASVFVVLFTALVLVRIMYKNWLKLHTIAYLKQKVEYNAKQKNEFFSCHILIICQKPHVCHRHHRALDYLRGLQSYYTDVCPTVFVFLVFEFFSEFLSICAKKWCTWWHIEKKITQADCDIVGVGSDCQTIVEMILSIEVRQQGFFLPMND